MKGKIYLIPNLLGESDLKEVIPAGIINKINTIHHFVVENIRTARRFLIQCGHPASPDEIHFFELDKHKPDAGIEEYITLCMKGTDIGIISEAGIPCVADPGSFIVKAAHKKGINIVPFTGPSSILLALSASGMNGQHFVFHGYLPIKKPDRIRKIREIEQQCFKLNQTQIFIETPYRNMSLLSDIVTICDPNTLLCIASEITTPHESIKMKSIMTWRQKLPDLHKKPCVFLLSAG